MIRALRATALIALGATLSLVVPALTEAQSRSGSFGAGRAPASFRSSSVRVPLVSSNRIATRNPLIGTPLFPNFAPIPFAPAVVPGLGFDYEHLVAVTPPTPDRFGRLHSGRLITPVFFAGPPYYADSYFGDDIEYGGVALLPQPVSQQPEVYLPQAPQYDPAREPTVSGPQVSDAAPDAPVPDAGELILMRSDGQVAMAVAFTTVGDRLTYITREGIRRSFSLSELDKDTTLQMNEANGTTLTLPN